MGARGARARPSLLKKMRTADALWCELDQNVNTSATNLNNLACCEGGTINIKFHFGVWQWLQLGGGGATPFIRFLRTPLLRTDPHVYHKSHKHLSCCATTSKGSNSCKVLTFTSFFHFLQTVDTDVPSFPVIDSCVSQYLSCIVVWYDLIYCLLSRIMHWVCSS